MKIKRAQIKIVIELNGKQHVMSSADYTFKAKKARQDGVVKTKDEIIGWIAMNHGRIDDV